jgi:hypothetical protein
MYFNMLYNAENRERTYVISYVDWLIISRLIMII